MKKLFAFFCTICLFALSFSAIADQSSRSNKWEFGLILNYTDNWEASSRNGSNIEVDDDVGFGFSIGYNYSEHFNFGFEFLHNEQSYDATIVPVDPPGLAFDIGYKLTNDAYNFNFTYNILDRKFTPFINGGLGWTYLDSNISDSNGGTVCWWDPWWGYVCDSYYSTYSDTTFSYSVGGGLRWDIGRNFSIKASVNQKWVDIDALGDTPDMLYSKIEFVWLQ